MKKLKKVLVVSTIVILMVALTTLSNAAIQGWDLVDSGKHLDYKLQTKYVNHTNVGIGLWEGHRQGVIRKDTLLSICHVVILDVDIDDYIGPYVAMCFQSGRIEYYEYHFSSMSYSQRVNAATHELGHALGLDHTNSMSDIMYPNNTTITALSGTDKNSYDVAYNTY